MKFAPLTGVPGVNRGDTPERGWITTESKHTVCLIFGRVFSPKTPRVQI